MNRLSLRAAIALGVVLGGAPLAAVTVDYHVNSLADGIDDDVGDGVCHTAAGTCTLRAAVMQGNVLTVPTVVTIHLGAGTHELTRPLLDPDTPEQGDLDLTDPGAGDPLIEIRGAGAALTIVDANSNDRLLDIGANRRVDLYNLTLTKGFALSNPGGGIRNSGTLRVFRCAVLDNVSNSGPPEGASTFGGGIYNGGSLEIQDSTIADNYAGASGGGIFNEGSMTIDRSNIRSNHSPSGPGGGVWSFGVGPHRLRSTTVSGNTAADGAGLAVSSSGANLILEQVTVAGNISSGEGGGIVVQGAATANVYNSTIARNLCSSSFGGCGLANILSLINLRNTSFALNRQDTVDGPLDDCKGQIDLYGNNLYSAAPAGCNLVVQFGTTDLLVGALANLGENGGPTETIAPLPGSNAIDGADQDLGCIDSSVQLFADDQRGAPRSLGEHCDIGALESEALFFDGFESGDRTNGWAP